VHAQPFGADDGRLAVRSGTQSVPLGTRHYGLVPWEITIAEALRNNGYATAINGNGIWATRRAVIPPTRALTNGSASPTARANPSTTTRNGLRSKSNLADAQSIDEADRPKVLEARSGSAPDELRLFTVDERRRIDAEITRRTIDFMERQKKAGKPFFAYVR